jgi:hypothetical protein
MLLKAKNQQQPRQLAGTIHAFCTYRLNEAAGVVAKASSFK